MFVIKCRSRTKLNKKRKFLQLLITKISIVMISKRGLFLKTEMFFFRFSKGYTSNSYSYFFKNLV